MVILKTLNILLTLIEYLIFARALITWLPIPKENSLIKMLYMITEPILAPIRALIEKSQFAKNMMFDISPLVALILIVVIRNFIGV